MNNDMLKQVNELSFSSIINWGVQVHNDDLWNKIHDVTIAHSPEKRRPVNKYATTGTVFELMIEEVYSDIVNCRMIENNGHYT